MNPTKEQRDAAYEKAPESVRAKYGAPESGQLLREVFTAHKLPEEQYPLFALAVGDAMLGLLSKTELAAFLREKLGVSSETVATLVEDVSTLFGHTSDIPEMPASAEVPPKERVEFRPVGISSEDTSQNDNDDARPITREELLGGLYPKRTMDDDIDRIEEKETQSEHKEEYAESRRPAINDGNVASNDRSRAGSTATVPRYSKPLAETPKYGGDTSFAEEDNPQV